MVKKIFQKKYLIIMIAIVALMILVTITNKANPDEEVKQIIQLTDIINHWAQSDIEFMQSKGAISGYEDNTFKPDNNVTTGEAIKLIVANFDKTIVNGEKHWASNYLQYAKDKGVVLDSQYQINTIDGLVTRKEVMYMVINSLEKLAYKPVITNNEIKIQFKDADITINKNGVDYYSAIKKCYLLGIVIGDENKNINPNENITRAELVTILTRAYNEGRRQYQYDYKVYNKPSNASTYGVLMDIMPNNFYETYATYKNGESPYFYNHEKYYDFSKDAQKYAKTKLETAVSAMINVSYDMSDEEWSQWKNAMLNYCDVTLNDIYDEENEKSKADEYIEYIKENKITIRGGVIVDPTTLGKIKDNREKYELAIKGMINVEVLSNPKKVKKLTYNDFINKETTLYNKQDCNYVLLKINDEDYTGLLNYVKLSLDGITYIKEG